MTQKLVLAGLLAAAILLAFYHPTSNVVNEQTEIFTSFVNWMEKHSKVYRNEEQKLYRFNKYRTNYFIVRDHNKKFEQGLESYNMELNKFADLDRIEFKATYLGLKRKGATSACQGSITQVSNPPTSVDWTATGKFVTGVKDQGQCGSCWAFSTTGSLETLAAIETSTLPSLSEQQIVDCAGGSYQNEGCNGGDMPNAMWYVIDNGITNEAQYPYRARDQKCAYKGTMKVYGISDCALVPANKTAWLVSAVVAQTVSISVEADQIGFQLYKSGVFSGSCGTNLDHGILLVGYGNQGGKDFWKAKNSWGASWGSNGYILLAKGADGPGQCGILMQNSVPLHSA